MPPEIKEIFTKKRIRFLIAYAVAFLALLLISYHTQINGFIITVLDLFSSVFLGLILAYICNPIFRFFERKVFFRLHPSPLRRAISLLCSYLLLLLVVVLILLLILPQLIAGITAFVTNYNTYVEDVIESINGTIYAINDVLRATVSKTDLLTPIDNTQFFDWIYRMFDQFLEQVNVNELTAMAGDLVGGVADVIFALFISIYLLISKEKRYMQIMKLRNALFGTETNIRITKICTTADNMFGKFVEGKILDSLIVGVLTYVAMALFGIPYAILIAAFVAVMNIIPYLGFLLALIPSSLIVLLISPSKILPFLLIAFIIYQIDVNILSPKIIGNNTGVSTLCVIIAICTMGAFAGLAGVIFAVPLFATVLEIMDALIHHRLQKKKLPDDVENYYAPNTPASPHDNKRNGSDKLNQRIERRYLRAKKLIEMGEEASLNRMDRIALNVYTLGRRLRIMSPPTPDVLTQFSAKETERNILRCAAQQKKAAMTGKDGG